MTRPLGEFEQRLLQALLHLGDEAYTVTIREVLEAWTHRSVSAGAIYTALERLARRGFVSSRFGDPTPERGGKRKKFYRLEAKGAEAVRQAQQALARMQRDVASKLRSLS